MSHLHEASVGNLIAERLKGSQGSNYCLLAPEEGAAWARSCPAFSLSQGRDSMCLAPPLASLPAIDKGQGQR